MTHEKIVDRVRKLLALSKSANVNESANAAAAAQKLMTQHNVTEAMVDVSPDEDEKVEDDVLHVHGPKGVATWKGALAVALCEVNQCLCYKNGGEIHIVGTPSDANTSRYLFSYVVREIERLCKDESGMRGAGENLSTWRNNFKLGAMTEINKRLRQAHQEAKAAMRQEADASDDMGTGTALMRVNTAITKLDDRMDAAKDYGRRELHLTKGSKSRTRYNAGARSAGERAGAGINLNGGGPALGSGNRGRLGS